MIWTDLKTGPKIKNLSTCSDSAYLRTPRIFFFYKIKLSLILDPLDLNVDQFENILILDPFGPYFLNCWDQNFQNQSQPSFCGHKPCVKISSISIHFLTKVSCVCRFLIFGPFFQLVYIKVQRVQN